MVSAGQPSSPAPGEGSPGLLQPPPTPSSAPQPGFWGIRGCQEKGASLSLAWSTELNLGQQRLQGRVWGGMGEDVASLLHTMSQSHAGQQWGVLKHHISG